jgi:hypothetical protein
LGLLLVAGRRVAEGDFPLIGRLHDQGHGIASLLVAGDILAVLDGTCDAGADVSRPALQRIRAESP